MKIVFTRDAPGMPPEMLGVVLGCSADELLIVVRTEDGDEAAPDHQPLDLQPADYGEAEIAPQLPQPEASTPVSHRVAAGKPADYIGAGPSQHDVYTGTGNPVADACALGKSVTVTDLPPVDPIADTGHALGTVQAYAKSLLLDLTCAGGLYTLTGAFGSTSYSSLPQVVATLKARARARALGFDMPMRPLGSGIQDPPTSDAYRRQMAERAAMPVYVPPAEPPPLGRKTAGQITNEVKAQQQPGESADQCLARLGLQAQAAVPPIVMLDGRRGTTYRNDRLGDISPSGWE